MLVVEVMKRQIRCQVFLDLPWVKAEVRYTDFKLLYQPKYRSSWQNDWNGERDVAPW